MDTKPNMWLMGLAFCYFLVLTPTGFQVIIEHFDPSYTTQGLIPNLVRFWKDVVLPAFHERDQLGRDNVQTGWLPSETSKRFNPEHGAEPPLAKRMGPQSLL